MPDESSITREAVRIVQADPKKYSGGTAGLYGTAAQMPAAFVEESAKAYLDTMFTCGDADGDAVIQDTGGAEHDNEEGGH